MKSKVIFHDDARLKLVAGVNELADAVSITLGPRAKNVAIAKATAQGEIYERKVIDDGVGVARSIELEDEAENMGVAIVREASQKQVDEVGDGTTAVIVLAREIINQALRQISQGKSSMEVRKELEDEAKLLVEKLKTISKPIKRLKDKIAVASISSKDPELGKMIGETFEKYGLDGVITVEESKSTETVVDHQDGMQFDKGYVSPYFITDPNTMTATLENTHILITDLDVTNIMEMREFFEKELASKTKILTIISPNIGGDALPVFVNSKMQGVIQILCVHAPSFGQNQKDFLQDIAILTGGVFITKDANRELSSVKFEELGFAKRITSTKNATIIVGGAGTKSGIKSRIQTIKSQIETEENEFDKEKLKERLGKLSNGIAVIRVGGQTEVEMKERKERAMDAVSATRSAIKDGIVAGGEVIYLKIRNILPEGSILRNALKKPFYQLLENSGIDISETQFDINTLDNGTGIDVTDSRIKDMLEVGIIDPASVAINAILNSVSVSNQIITTGAMIVPIIEKKK